MTDCQPTADVVQAPFAHVNFSRVHTRSVARLAVSLFDQTIWLHGMGDAERRLLWHAALLHDIGQGIEYTSHHKHSMSLILECEALDLDPPERRLVACLARYHRGANPKRSHPIYGDLGADDRARVRKLAALLRLADGLDRGQIGRVEAIQVTTCGGNQIAVRVYADQPPAVELDAARKKASLFESVFGLAVCVKYEGKRP